MGLQWLLNYAFTQQAHPIGGNAEQKDEKSRNPEEEEEDLKKKKKTEVGGVSKEEYPNGFYMPLHYPRYTKQDYEKMDEKKLDLLLKQYGLCFHGDSNNSSDLDQKRAFAIGTFLWPDQL